MTSEYLDLRPGDHVTGSTVAALARPGPARWYALRVRPQHEDQAEAWLRRRGVYAFHPVRERRTLVRGRVRLFHRRYLPGYVFARFRGDPLCHLVMACPFILGAICRADGEWGVLAPKGLTAIHAMRKMDEDQARTRAEMERRRRALHVGDAVLFRSGPLAGFSAEVVAVTAEDGVEVRFTLFGREALITTSPADIERRRDAA